MNRVDSINRGMDDMKPLDTIDVPSMQGKVSDEEWAIRVDLACAYRMVAHHDRCGDELSRPPGEDRYTDQPPVVERLPQGGGLVFGHQLVDARHVPVGGDDESASDPESRRCIAECRLHRCMVAAGNGGTEAEVSGQQLSGILELARALLPQSIVDCSARLQLAFDLARGGASDERSKRDRHRKHRCCEE